MICRSCIRRVSAFRAPAHPTRTFVTAVSSGATSSPRTAGPPAATSTGAAQPFSTPLSPAPNDVSLGVGLRPKSKPKAAIIPVSSCPAGTSLKGLNFLKGKEDPVALQEEEYPEWLWTCLSEKTKGDDASGSIDGDEFSKSKKQRRLAAKRQRKLEERMVASGDTSLLQPKIPLQQQSIDLPSNLEGSQAGATEAIEAREALTAAMRKERRSKIKEANFLKGMR